MKWFDEIKLSAKSLPVFNIGLKLTASKEVNDTALLTECVSNYLQKMILESRIQTPAAVVSDTINFSENYDEYVPKSKEALRGFIPVNQTIN